METCFPCTSAETARADVRSWASLVRVYHRSLGEEHIIPLSQWTRRVKTGVVYQDTYALLELGKPLAVDVHPHPIVSLPKLVPHGR